MGASFSFAFNQSICSSYSSATSPTSAVPHVIAPFTMDLDDLQTQLAAWVHEAAHAFQKVPGSAVLIRYVRSSYQNDPIRSAIELVLVIFFIRYLLAPSYSTQKQNFIKLRDDVRGDCCRRSRACPCRPGQNQDLC